MSKKNPGSLTVIDGAKVEARPPEYSDDALALKFADLHEDDRRYVASLHRWVDWDDTRWRPDDTMRAYDDVRAVCRAAAESTGADPKIKKAVCSAATVAGVEKLARADRRFAMRATDFDANPWLLNTPIGTVDLETLETRPARREDLITMITRVGPAGECPRWLDFLKEVTGGDLELERFLARAVGYTLTGSTREQAMFFLFGGGANGKSVFIETISAILGDYARAAPIEMFTFTKFSTHSTDVAGLQGARMSTTSETEANKAFAEAKLKQLTGGDRISARRMRADNVEFLPMFKLWLSGNHRPRISSSDEAIRRRLHLVPFGVTIAPWRRDKTLPEKLKAEWPGIMAWALEGCREWRQIGLAPPAAVRNATDEYLAAEDTLLQWLGDHILFDSKSRATTDELFASWRKYAEGCNENPGAQKDFVKALRNKNLELEHTRDGNRWIGLRLLGKDQ